MTRTGIITGIIFLFMMHLKCTFWAKNKKKYNEKHSLCSLQSGHSQHLAKWIILKVSWFQKLKPRGMIFQNYRIRALEFRKNEWWKSKQGMIWWKGGSLSCHYYSLVHSPHLSIGTNMQFQTCHYRNILKSCNGDSQSFPNFVIWNNEKVTLLRSKLFMLIKEKST